MNRLKDINLVAVHTHSCIHTGVSRKIKSKSQYSECKATISNDGSFLVEKRGITLIALIITIIILLILAAVTINALVRRKWNNN